MTIDLRNRRVAIYARYSSALQSEASIEDQVRRCTTFVERAGGVVAPELVFTDMAVSGSSLARRGFEHLMQQVNHRPRAVDVIVTEDLSRISRDFADAAKVFKVLQYLDVPLLGVADGIDTSARHAKMTFTMKALVSDMYLDDLRDKTLRGLEGHALAGLSTGGGLYGYRSVEISRNARKRVCRLEIDEEKAEVVRRVFNLYLEGKSLSDIARLLTEGQVEPPRANTKHRLKGWIAGTIRNFLHNEAYIGRWSYKKREWRKAPGSNSRRPRMRDLSDVIRADYPERRIIDQATWDAVQAKLAKVRAHYAGKSGGRPGRRTTHPLSGLLVCGECGAPMMIAGGSSTRYYRCSHAMKRGTCANRLSVREDVTRARILGTLRDRFASPEGIRHLRQRIAEGLNRAGHAANSELVERQERLTRTEGRIGGLVQFIADGDRSEYVTSALRDLEAQARTEKAAIQSLRASASRPIPLPGVDEIVATALNLERVIAEDPTRAREELTRWFEGGTIKLKPQAGGFYVAESKFLPLVAMGFGKQEAGAFGGSGLRAPAVGCAGRI